MTKRTVYTCDKCGSDIDHDVVEHRYPDALLHFHIKCFNECTSEELETMLRSKQG